MSQLDVKFANDPHDKKIISLIGDRAFALYRQHGVKRPKLEIIMDVSATHANGNPLRLEALLNADDFNFMHDVGGIARHLDRDTGKLTNCFLPRFSVPVAQRAGSQRPVRRRA
jgi:hypothetical protein